MLADPGSNGNAVGRGLKAAGWTAPAISIWRGVPERPQPRRDGVAIQSFFCAGLLRSIRKTADLPARDDAANHPAEVGGEPLYRETALRQDRGDSFGLAQPDLGCEQPTRPQQPEQVRGDRAIG